MTAETNSIGVAYRSMYRSGWRQNWKLTNEAISSRSKSFVANFPERRLAIVKTSPA
jgi:hypothetical protein